MNLLNSVGETSSYDKKVRLEERRPKSWLKSVSAFANTNGGQLLFGVDDNDQHIGLTDAKKDAETISEIIKTKMDPIPQIDLEVIRLDNKDFVVLTVLEGKETSYYPIM